MEKFSISDVDIKVITRGLAKEALACTRTSSTFAFSSDISAFVSSTIVNIDGSMHSACKVRHYQVVWIIEARSTLITPLSLKYLFHYQRIADTEQIVRSVVESTYHLYSKDCGSIGSLARLSSRWVGPLGSSNELQRP